MLLYGSKVFLRRLQSSDLGRTLDWVNDPEIMVIMGVRGPRTQEMQQQWFDKVSLDHGEIVFAICVLESGEHIGNVSLDLIDPINRNARFAIFIGDNNMRGKAYGFEATKLAVEYGFFYLNLHKIYVKASQDYVAAIKIYKRLGFNEEGLLKEHEYREGNYVDKVCLGLLRKDFIRLYPETIGVG